MAIFENSDTLSPNSEFFYLSSNHDVLYSRSDTPNTFCLDVPSYFISSRYGKLAFHIYRNLLCSNCIARLSSKHIRVNFIKLFVNSYLKLKMNKTPNEPSEKLNKFILALPSVEQLKKYICKIEQMDKSKCDINRLVKRAALVKVILFVYENHYAKYDIPFYNKYTEVLELYIKLYSAISNEMLIRANTELKKASKLFSKKINYEFKSTDDYIYYYTNKKLKLKNISRGISKEMFIV